MAPIGAVARDVAMQAVAEAGWVGTVEDNPLGRAGEVCAHMSVRRVTVALLVLHAEAVPLVEHATAPVRVAREQCRGGDLVSEVQPP